VPGTTYTADGLEKNEAGTPSSGARDHRVQLDKRARKLEQFDYGRLWADVEGDGELDPANTDIGANDVPVIRGAEVCDGGQVDDDALSDFCQMICKLEPGDAPSSLALRCDAICGETCRSFTAPPMDPDPIGAARCCVRGGEGCDPTIPCCFDLDNGTMGEGCTLVAVDTPDGTTFVDRCRSI